MSRSSHRRFVNYIDRSREYYAAKGYETPYGWATGNSVPFTMPRKPLAQSTVALVTTAATNAENERQYHRAEASVTPASMVTDHLSWHKTATTTDDVGAFLPLDHLRELASDGEVRAIGPFFYSTPTLYSHRRTTANAERLADDLRADGVDVAVLSGL